MKSICWPPTGQARSTLGTLADRSARGKLDKEPGIKGLALQPSEQPTDQ